MPVNIKRLKQYLPRETPQDKPKTAAQEAPLIAIQPLSRKIAMALALYLLLAFTLEFAALYRTAAPGTQAELYANSGLSQEAQDIRAQLLSLGADSKVVNDFPEQELRNFRGVTRCEGQWMRSEDITRDDEGSLMLYQMVGMLPKGVVRVLYYYQWQHVPEHGYTDVLSLAGNSSEEWMLLQEPQPNALSLYEKDGKTYRQKAQNDGAWLGVSELPASALDSSVFGYTVRAHQGDIIRLQFRLHKNYKNQRGFVAFSSQKLGVEEDTSLYLGATYIHQRGIWNKPFVDPLNSGSATGYHSLRTSAFRSESFDTTVAITH